MEEADTILKGVQLLLTALEIDHAYIGIEANKPLAIKHLANIVPENVDVMRLKAKYPQGAEKQLIYATTHRIVPTGELPAKVGCVVCNAHTAYAIAKAVYEGEPCYKRAMTVSGGGVKKRGNFWVRNGVQYQYIYDVCRGDKDEEITRKVVSGGPMMGFAQASLVVIDNHISKNRHAEQHTEYDQADNRDLVLFQPPPYLQQLRPFLFGIDSLPSGCFSPAHT